MDPLNAERTAFQTHMDNFHYTIMPFDLKNARETYQRAMTVIFYYMLHACLEDYPLAMLIIQGKSSQDVDSTTSG